jgi:hypothetical protein
MALEEYSMQRLVSMLRTAHFQSYLLSHGWVETSSRFGDQLRFEVTIEGDADPYELYVPASVDVANFQTRLIRNIFKLCSIEDREASDIAREMIENHVEAPPSADVQNGTRLRVHNSGTTPLVVRMDSPERQYTLYANDAIELTCRIGEGEKLDIERDDTTLVLRTSPSK